MVTHKTFDEAHMTSHATALPLMAHALQRARHKNTDTAQKDLTVPQEASHLKVKLLSPHEKSPNHSTLGSAGLDLYCLSDVII